MPLCPCTTTVPEICRGRGAPGCPSASHSLATRAHSSVLQNGCSSASLKRLRRALDRKHSSCRLLPLLVSARSAPANSRQQESLCQA